MLMQGLALLFTLTLILPAVQLVRIYRATKTWRYNLLRVLFGDLSGLVILGTTYTGYQHLGTGSPNIVPPLAYSFGLLILALIDLYRAEDKGEELGRAVFYSATFLAVILQLLAAVINLTYYI